MISYLDGDNQGQYKARRYSSPEELFHAAGKTIGQPTEQRFKRYRQ